jgi:hypothetical protein
MMAKIDLSAVEARINQSREHFDTMMIPTADAGALLDQLIQARAELEQLRAAAVGVSAALPVDLKDLPDIWQPFGAAMAALRQLL